MLNVIVFICTPFIWCKRLALAEWILSSSFQRLIVVTPYRAVEELESRRELLLQLEDSDGTQLSPETTARAVDVLRERKKFQKYISRFLNT